MEEGWVKGADKVSGETKRQALSEVQFQVSVGREVVQKLSEETA